MLCSNQPWPREEKPSLTRASLSEVKWVILAIILLRLRLRTWLLFLHFVKERAQTVLRHRRGHLMLHLLRLLLHHVVGRAPITSHARLLLHSHTGLLLLHAWLLHVGLLIVVVAALGLHHHLLHHAHHVVHLVLHLLHAHLTILPT